MASKLIVESARPTTVRDEIGAAETSEQADAAFSATPFEAIKADLDRLIATVRSSRAAEEPNRALPIHG